MNTKSIIRNVVSLFFLLSVAISVSSCSINADKRAVRNTVKNSLTALKNNDLDEYKTYYKSGLSSLFKGTDKNSAEIDASQEHDGISSFSITKTTLFQKNGKAVVKYNITFNDGTKSEFESNWEKEENGQWKRSIVMPSILGGGNL